MRLKRVLLCLFVGLLLLGSVYADPVGQADKRWRSPVAAVINLPTVGNQVGDIRYVTGTSSLYGWTGATWVVVASGSLSSLSSGHIFVGNAFNVPTDVAMTGDVSITSGGVTAVADDSHAHTGATLSSIALANTLLTATPPLVWVGNDLQMPAANATTSGYITFTDWVSFNSKPSGLTDTLDTVCARGSETQYPISVNAAGGITLGKDEVSPTPNIPGYIEFKSAGDTAYTLSLIAATMVGDSDYTLPTGLPGGAAFLKSDAAGVLSWDTSTYLTSESDTFNAVTARGNVSSNPIIIGESNSTVTTSDIQIAKTSDFPYFDFVADDDYWGAMSFQSSGGTLDVPTISSNGTTVGSVDFYGHDGTGWRWAASIYAELTDTPATGNYIPSKIVIDVADNTNSSRTSSFASDTITLDSDNVNISGNANVQGGLTINSAVTGALVATAGVVGAVNGVTNSTGFWLCTASDCSSSCQANVVSGVIESCL